MSARRVGQILTVVAVAAGVLSASDPALVPEVVRGWAGLASTLVAAVGGALGFNTGAPAPVDVDLPRYQRLEE